MTFYFTGFRFLNQKIMQVAAKVKYIKTSPRKTRIVVNLVRGMNVSSALDQLQFSNKKVAHSVSKLLNSAIANAKHNYSIDKNNLYIKEIKVDEGPVLKRWMPRAHGRATPLRKRMSHINLILSELKDSGEIKARQQEIEAPIKLGEEPKAKEAPKKEKKIKKSESKKDNIETKEQGKDTIDSRGEGRGGHTKIEGKSSNKGFIKKMFRRKSG